MPDILTHLTEALKHPFQIRWTEHSFASILVCSGLYVMGICLYQSERGRTRDGEEHGSAAWASSKQVNAMFAQKQNKILTRQVRLGLDTHKHRRSLNVLQAIILMLFQEAPEYEQNFSMVMRVLEYAEVKEEDEEYVSPLDLLFQAIERENPNSVAVHQYKVFKMAAGKTSKSILVSTAVRLAPFNLPQIQAITDHDDMDLYTLGEKKVAVYAVIPDNDNTFNFLVSLLYSQAFQTLYYSADQIHHGALPRHVHFVLDEFAAMPLPGFTRELATMRSRNISASTIIQNMAQIKELYKDSWETIPGNSDTILYLGGNEASTHKYISEALGKATIDTRTYGQTRGRSGSYSTNFQMSGRELLTPDEVRGLDNRYAILFIRGAKPVMDLKYELTDHPAIRHTVDGGGPPYIHKGRHKPAFQGIPLFQAFSAGKSDEEKENAT